MNVEHFIIKITRAPEPECAESVGSFVKDGERGWLVLTAHPEQAVSFGNRAAAERYWQRKRRRVRAQFSVEIVPQ